MSDFFKRVVCIDPLQKKYIYVSKLPGLWGQIVPKVPYVEFLRTINFLKKRKAELLGRIEGVIVIYNGVGKKSCIIFALFGTGASLNARS